MNNNSYFLAFCQTFIGCLLILLLAGSCATVKGGKKTSKHPDEYSFIVLQMNDVYEIAPLEKGKVGGLARVATIRKRLLKENPNVITVLAGDFLNPSLIGTMKYQNKSIKGRQMVEVMNEIGVDVVAFGNHEFDIKEHELQERMNESEFEWIGTNVMHQVDNEIEPFYKENGGQQTKVPEYYTTAVTHMVTGKRIDVGMYSACINSNPKDWVYYEDPYKEAKTAFAVLEKDAEVVIGLTHLSLAEDLKMATQLPNSAFIMGGHEHENSRDTVGKVVVMKADANAKSVYVHRVTYNAVTKKTKLESTLIPITDKIKDDPEVKMVVDKWQHIQEQKIAEVVDNPNEVIYHASVPLDGREVSVRNKQTNLAGIIAGSMAASLRKKADGALFNGGSIRLDDQLTGDITAVDIFRAMPFGGKIYEIDIKGDLLKQTLDAGMENKGVGGYLQWDGIDYNSGTGSWEINGINLDESKTYHIAASEYLANGKESRLEFFKPENFVKWETAQDHETEDLRIDIRKATIEFMKKM